MTRDMKLQAIAHPATFGRDCVPTLQSGLGSKKSSVQEGRILEAFWSPMNRGIGSRLPNIIANRI